MYYQAFSSLSFWVFKFIESFSVPTCRWKCVNMKNESRFWKNTKTLLMYNVHNMRLTVHISYFFSSLRPTCWHFSSNLSHQQPLYAYIYVPTFHIYLVYGDNIGNSYRELLKRSSFFIFQQINFVFSFYFSRILTVIFVCTKQPYACAWIRWISTINNM